MIVQDLVHDNKNLCHLWHRRLGHLHYREFLILRGLVTGFLEFSIEKKGLCRGCTLGNNTTYYFPRSESRTKGILDRIHLYVNGMMLVASL
jgi:hypothetical protein